MIRNILSGKSKNKSVTLKFILIMYSIPSLLQNSIEKFPARPALAFVSEHPVTYSQLEKSILRLIEFLKEQKISKGDKVILWGSNSPQWGIIYLAVTSTGAVIVPVLPEMTPENAETIYKHSEAKIAFLSSSIIEKNKNNTNLRETPSFEIEKLDTLTEDYEAAGSINGFDVTEEDLAALIYTSGTTGAPKGVMLSHLNICFVAIHGGDIQPIDEKDRFLSLLPMAHTYENSLGLLFPMFNGSSVYYLRKAPTPSVLISAMAEIKPSLILSVPLIIEKLYRQRIKSKFAKKNFTGVLYKITPFRLLFHYLAGKKLKQTFGGHLKFFGIGGAKLNPEVEKFLIEARFPYAIGYGLTESAPLLAGANPSKARFESTGPAMPGVTLRINNPDPKTGEGEIWAKGPSIMKGYYKDEVQTNAVLTPDGWLRTGDLGKFDKDQYLYIKGRLKNVIIGSNGKNIYPEEIEALINNCEIVSDSLVLQRKGRLVALVQYNAEIMELKYQALKEELSHKVDELADTLREEIMTYVNARVSPLMRLADVELQAIPFEKTATLKIKRYLYS